VYALYLTFECHFIYLDFTGTNYDPIYLSACLPACLSTYLPTYLLTNLSIHWLGTLQAIVLPGLTQLHSCVVLVVYSAVAATKHGTFDVG